MRKFQVTIEDRDGEEYSYEQEANTLWEVLRGIDKTMIITGNFYGHIESETSNVRVDELV